MVINIKIEKCIATYLESDETPVCGNNRIEVKFQFDQEWDGVEKKTARFIWGDKHHDEEIVGDTCKAPMFLNTTKVLIGVYAGEAPEDEDCLASTMASVEYKTSARCTATAPSADTGEHYTNEARGYAAGAKQSEVIASNAAAECSEALKEISELTSECIGTEYPFEFGGVGTTDGSLTVGKARMRALVPIRQNEISLEVTVPSDAKAWNITAFDKSGAFVGKISTFQWESGKLSFQADCAVHDHVYVTFCKNDNTVEFTEDEVNSSYVMHRAVLSKLAEDVDKTRATLDSVVEKMPDFSTKKMVSLGDSITYGFIPRNDEAYPGQLKSYAQITAETLGMAFENHGVSGSTVIYCEDRNPMCERVANLPSDADIVTFMGGTNDARIGIEILGTMSDRGNETFYGALHIVMSALYEKYFIAQGTEKGAKTKVIVCTPIKNLLASSSARSEGSGDLSAFEPFVNAIKEVAAYYSFPVVDFYNDSMINPHLNRTLQGTEEGYTGYYNPYVPDGTHPNQQGAQIMADLLISYISKLNFGAEG